MVKLLEHHHTGVSEPSLSILELLLLLILKYCENTCAMSNVDYNEL